MKATDSPSTENATLGLPPELKARWIANLRSGTFPQGLHALHDGERYCCLGVLNCTQNGANGMDAAYSVDGVTGYTFVERLLGRTNSEILQQMNDSEGKSFAEIADWIQANL